MKNSPPPPGARPRLRSAPKKKSGPWFRLPWLLYIYIANELLAPFFASFLILYSVFFLIRLIPLLDVVLALRIGPGDFVRLFSYIFPRMLLYIIPMASMAGVIIGFTRLTNDREILALKACGVSLRQMLPPVLLIAAAIACLTGFFSIRLIPAGALGVKQLMFQLAKEKIDKGLKEKEFTEALGDIVVYVDKIDDQQNWHGVYVSDMRGRTQPLITVAKSGRMAAEMERMQVTITLDDGTLHNAEGPDNQVIRFKQYQLQISLRPPTKVGGEDITTLGRGAMSQQQLLNTCEKLGRDTRPGRMLLSEYHHRLVLPVSCFILSLLGMPLGLQARAGKRAVGIPLGLAFFILYYITFTTARVLSESGTLPLVFGMWLPNILFLLLTIFIFRRVDQERPLIPEPLQDFFIAGFNQLLRPLYDRMTAGIGRLLTSCGLRQPSSPATAPDQERRLPIHADGATGIFHLSNCTQYHGPRCRIKFKNAAVAQKAGFVPCEFCKKTLAQPDRRTSSSN
ncbi:MAG: LPS export ABC transporter permease LptF [Desulfobulbaceae bacterium]|nr:LPS export ABC transporter permease LptF [Desulfobulbaceae bacterium]